MGHAPDFIGEFEVHPAANLFPEMDGENLSALSESIRENGVRVPICFYDGKLIDGRNRARACIMAGLRLSKIPKRNLDSAVDPFEWAWDANCSRLDYSAAQKAAIRIKVEKASGEWQQRIEAGRKQANESRAKKLDERRGDDGKVKPASPVSRDTALEPVRQRERVAEAAHVSQATVARVQKIEREDPEAFEELAETGRLPADHPLRAKRPKPERWGEPPHDVDGFVKYAAAHFDAVDLEFISKLLALAAIEAA